MEEKITSTEELGYYLAPEVLSQIKAGREQVLKSNLDRVFCIDGREGLGGKSTLAFQLAYAYDKTFNIKRIVFTSKDFEECLRSASKGQAIVWDEAFVGLSSKGSLSKENKKLVRLLMECRQLGLFIFIVLPTFFYLEKYVAIFRSQALFHCYSSKKSINRRYFKIYNYTNKKLLYIYGKNLLSYYKPKLPHTYRFYAKFPPTINRKEYNDKKLNAFRQNDVETPIETRILQQRNLLLYLCCKKGNISQAELCRHLTQAGFGLTKGRMSQIIGSVPQKFSV